VAASAAAEPLVAGNSLFNEYRDLWLY